ncbi:hypothetical protein HYU22_02645 [Candidatus Woesearchaeota archaeon]|nr:hypothetical protein [Candidatus Woesearchaeota archaeon]
MSFSWVYPRAIFSRMEIAFLLFLGFIIFLLSWLEFGRQFTLALALASLFMGIYVFAAQRVHAILKPKHTYHLGKVLHITREQGKRVHEEVTPVREIVHHKIDRFFRGGYILTAKGRKHQLFFNHPREIDRVEELLGKRK